MRKLFLIGSTCALLCGCISTPNTKALITPVGAVGYHTFAPPDSPDRMRSIDLEGLEQVAIAPSEVDSGQLTVDSEESR